MHFPVLVLGPDPVERCYSADFDGWTADWAAIGGRYTGQLIPRPGATSARVYGDALPSAEAHVAQFAPGARPHAAQGPGVDQLTLIDLDLDGTLSGGWAMLLDVDGTVEHPGYTSAEIAARIVSQLPTYVAELVGQASGADPSQLRAKHDAWHRRLGEVLAARAGDTLATVVDVHS